MMERLVRQTLVRFGASTCAVIARAVAPVVVPWDWLKSNPRVPLPGRRALIWSLWVGAPVAAALLVHYETRTSALESRMAALVASNLTYSVQPGPSAQIVFPKHGPFDIEHGYTRIPEFQARLLDQGFRIREQARFSPALALFTWMQISPPYHESGVAGLRIRGVDGRVLMDATENQYHFASYEDLPAVLVRTLLFLENRKLDDPSNPNSNPVVEWPRLAKAGFVWIGRELGLGHRSEGGSTLAVQLEKYRHSNRGRTGGAPDKLRQILSASLRVYQDGPDTRDARHRIVLDYLNSIPLAGAPGHGEIRGLGTGLQVWFGLDPDHVSLQLSDPAGGDASAFAYKHALALLYAVRAPDYYLVRHRDALERRVDRCAQRMLEGGVIDREMAERVRSIPLQFATPLASHPRPAAGDRKSGNSARTKLMANLGVTDLYTLDRLDLDVHTTVNMELQKDTESLFRNLGRREFAAQHGLTGQRLLLHGDPRDVTYSLLLFEATPEGNLLRAHADNLDQPLDINNGTKMELGSTAKLRTLVHYLEVVDSLHAEMAGSDPATLSRKARAARDPITRWVAGALAVSPRIPSDSLLSLALDRKYSASPGEAFFTGSGVHSFHNYDKADNARTLSVREATVRSTNLVFVRLMRDLVRFHESRLPYDPESVLRAKNPQRRQLLDEAARDEATEVLRKAYTSYRGMPIDAVPARLLSARAVTPARLAVLYFAWNHGASADSLSRWLRRLNHRVDAAQAHRLVRAYGNPRLTIADYGYLLHREPLEIWCAGRLVREPGLAWEDLLAASDEVQCVATAWLFQPRNRAAQERRLRARIEQDAFLRMTPYWRRAGFPFSRLVPSYATALGSSGDRPSALADLVGILVNDGMRRPPVLIRELRFAPDTPYTTDLEAGREPEAPVLSPAVARAARGVMAEVVERGTARGARGAFADGHGGSIVVGGKTGTGDNRFELAGRRGARRTTRVAGRTAAFAFYVGDRYFGVITTFVTGPRAGDYGFTSALPVAVFKLLAPTIASHLMEPGLALGHSGAPAGSALGPRPAPARQMPAAILGARGAPRRG
jgi:membrane peptidoglycan carboxypeptidase